MIQRIQSIFLFVVGIVAIIAIFKPFHFLSVHVNIDGQEVVSTIGLSQLITAANGNVEVTNDIYKAAALGIIGIIAFIAIFLYKNRTLQMRIVMLNIISTLLLAGGLAFFAYRFMGSLEVIKYSIEPLGCIALAILLLFNVLAYKFIKKDDELVKSADRFR